MPAQSNADQIASEIRLPLRHVDLTNPRSVHIVGIGGAGMRTIARILLAMGHRVSGSDRAASQHLTELEALGAQVFVGHQAGQQGDADSLTRSTAVPDDNPEVESAIAAGVEVLSRAEISTAITTANPVAGTHGKTTKSSMLAVVLDHAGRNPSFVIGSDVTLFGTGARWTPSNDFVVEADESDGS